MPHLKFVCDCGFCRLSVLFCQINLGLSDIAKVTYDCVRINSILSELSLSNADKAAHHITKVTYDCVNLNSILHYCL
jgi:hypothetical protein